MKQLVAALCLALLAGTCAAQTRPATVPSTAPATQPTTAPVPHQWYVSANGDDAADGSFAHPLRSTGKAHDRTRSGDTIYLNGGDTFDPIGFSHVNSITITGYGTGTPIIEGSGGGVTLLFCSDVQLINLHIRAAHRDPGNPDGLWLTKDFNKLAPDKSNARTAGDGIYAQQCDRLRVKSCLIEFWDYGIGMIGTNVDHPTVTDTTISHCYTVTVGDSHGIFHSGQIALHIDRCTIDTCGWEPALGAVALPTMRNHGLYSRDDGGGRDVLVTDTVVINCANSGLTAQQGGRFDGCLLINNDNAANAPNAWVGGPYGEITNCISIGGGLRIDSVRGRLAGNLILPSDGLPPLIVDSAHGHPNPRTAEDLVEISNNTILGWSKPVPFVMPLGAAPGLKVHDNACYTDQGHAAQFFAAWMKSGRR